MKTCELPIQHEQPHYTALRPILCGSFKLWDTPVSYFQTVLSLEDACDQLQLMENLPADLDCKWSREQILLRDFQSQGSDDEPTDRHRSSASSMSFFKPLTVALLPIGSNRKLAWSYGETPYEPPVKELFQRRPWQVFNVGSLQLIVNSETPHGYIRWDPKRIFAATIDGQERLAAFRAMHGDRIVGKSALETKISVLFLVLDPRVGFDIEKMKLAADENPILTVVREVFIDLNKHSREVERARRILLDDQEIESRCLRDLLATRVGELQDDRLPLGIVHWQHNVTAKFNTGRRTGPFVTTVELLHSILGDLLDLRRPKDPLDEGQVRKFVSSIEDALGVSDLIAADASQYGGLKPLMAYVERNHLAVENETPFANLPPSYLRVAMDGFNANLRPLILGVLTKIKPYKQFIQEVKKRGGIDGDLAFYLVQPKKAQKQTSTEWGDVVFNKKIEEPLDELNKMKQADWPFYAVFQKGLMRASVIAWRHFPVVGGTKASTIDDFLPKWISFIDELCDRGLFAVKASFPKREKERVWSGISLNVGAETIRWSESAVQRIAGILVIWWYFYSSKKSQVGSFIKKMNGPKSNESFPKGKELTQAVVKGIRSAITHNTDEEIEEAEIVARVEKRLRDLILLARNNAASDEDDDDGDEEGEAVAVDVEDSEADSSETNADE